MLEIKEKENENIVNMIYEIRGQQVMLDSDLASLYEVETKRINEAVKRNKEKFPKRFAWQLTISEYENLKSQFATSSLNNYGGRRKLPSVFTEQGVAMLATILKSPKATQVSIGIMDAFVYMRKYISYNLIEQKYINNQVMKNTEDIKLLQESFKEFDKNKKLNEIFFEGQIYDAYSLLIDILNTATENIVIIDNYAGKELLDILKDINKNITILSKNINDILITKYNKQYHNINFITNDTFHDRFIIIDNKVLYHCGASFKDLGKKCFAINKIEDINILNE